MPRLRKGQLIDDKYQIECLIAQGSFGKVYIGTNIQTKVKVAIKVEKNEMARHGTLQTEINILDHLKGTPQILEIQSYTKYQGQSLIISAYMGRDLQHYMKKYGYLSTQCINNVGLQMVTILEGIHTKGVIHRDIKPENILGNYNQSKITLIDFGISKMLTKGPHNESRQPFIGTVRFGSIAAHLEIDQGKKDDLESLGYVLIYLCTHYLPWMNIKEKKHSLISTIGQIKLTTPLETLCKHVPGHLLQYMKYIRSLATDATPNYQMLRGLFDSNLRVIGQSQLDWNSQTSNQSHSHHTKVVHRNHKVKKVSYRSQFAKFSKEDRVMRKVKSIQQPSPLQSSAGNTSIMQDESVEVIQANQLQQKQMQYDNKPVQTSTMDVPLYVQDLISFQAQQEILQFENQDLEIKYNLLHFRSVYYNHKNPIDKYRKN